TRHLRRSSRRSGGVRLALDRSAADGSGRRRQRRMTRVRFVAPSSGGLLVSGARVALANALFARAQNGHFILRLPAGDDRVTDELRFLGVVWDAIGNPADYAAAIEHLKSIGRLYPCFESET